MTMLKSAVAGLATLAVGGLALSASAHADLYVKNDTTKVLLVAVKYLDKQGCGLDPGTPWRARGWVVVAPKMTTTLLSGDLREKGGVFYYAESYDKTNA